jgi:alginate O-acetyltransferase complex protein AlgI
MLFDTPAYLLFLVLVVLIYWRLGWRRQNLFLLACSYFFYGWWDWRFLLLMIFSTCVDYYLSRRIAASTDAVLRKRLLVVSLVLNFAFLGFFKYFNFFTDSFADLLVTLGVHNVPRGLLQVLLPPGISFYTFQEVAYMVDVYFRKMEPADSLLDYGLFISLFPHLIAGPIQRPSHLLPQVQAPRNYCHRTFFDGLMLIAMGLFRKCVIADNCAPLANAAFAGKLGSGFWPTVIGVYAFAWQIYGDFSGYSDIARGSAQLLGFHFMVNFRQPYLATSLQDFWRRWHISLSTWLRDYLYIPLGGSRRGTRRTYINLFTTMVLGGFWHGANWTFVVWGALHGGWLSFERLWAGGETPRPRWYSRIVTLGIVALTWIFFRARSVPEAFALLAGLSSLSWNRTYGPMLIFLAIISSLMLTLDLIIERSSQEYALQRASPPWRVAFAATLMVILALAGGSQISAFIYFQF